MKTVKNYFIFILLAFSVLFSMNSCLDSSDNSGIEFTSEPTFELNPSGNVPLAGVLSVTTNKAVTIDLNINDGTDSWTVEFYDFDLSHELMVLGLKPDRTHSITLTAVDELGNERQADTIVQITTDPLPDDFPSYELLTADTSKMETGITIVEPIGITAERPYMFAVNTNGEVIWFFNQLGAIDFKRLDNGNILIVMEYADILEMDMLGNIVHSWKTPYSDSDDPDRIELEDTIAFHHEVYPMPSGNYIALDVEIREVENFPLEITADPADASITGTAKVAGDVIVEFTPDGTIVKQWKMHDIIDQTRVSHDSDGVFWGTRYPDVDEDGESDGTDSKDWCHSNAVIYDPSDDTIIVSLRHQDAVVKIDRNDTIVWILGDPFGWNSPYADALLDLVETPEAEWQYHQHAPMLTSEGTLLMFDNGNNRTIAFDGQTPMGSADSYSRVVEFDINTQTMQVTQLWQYGADLGDDTLYADFLGDVDQLPTTGNILINFGGLRENDSQYATQVIEVTHDELKEVVFKLVLNDYYSYRAARISSLY